MLNVLEIFKDFILCEMQRHIDVVIISDLFTNMEKFKF